MHGREVDQTDVRQPDGEPRFGDLILRTPPNWTAVAFLGMLGGLHLTFAALSFIAGHWEGFLSLILGSAITTAAAVAVKFRFELAVLPSSGRIRLRRGVGRFCSERVIPFSAIRGVRLTLTHPCIAGDGKSTGSGESRIELLSMLEDIECPPTRVPRQEALFLAMALDVPLIKVSGGSEPDEPVDDPGGASLSDNRISE